MACKKCPDNKPYNKSLAELPQSDFEAMIARNGDGMILEYTGPNRNKIPVRGPSSGKTYRTQITPDGMLIFNVHPEDAEVLMQRTRKSKPLFVEFQPPQKVVKAEPVKASAPKLPENDVVMDDIWADVPVESVEEDDKNLLEFDTVADFRDWLATEPSEDDLLKARIVEQNGKERKTIISEINKALNG